MHNTPVCLNGLQVQQHHMSDRQSLPRHTMLTRSSRPDQPCLTAATQPNQNLNFIHLRAQPLEKPLNAGLLGCCCCRTAQCVLHPLHLPEHGQRQQQHKVLCPDVLLMLNNPLKRCKAYEHDRTAVQRYARQSLLLPLYRFVGHRVLRRGR